MKLHLLHGPAINSSRQKLTQLKKGFDPNNIRVFDNGAKVEDVLGELMTIPLIEKERLIIWENPPEDFTNYPLTPVPCTLILWFDHEVDSKNYSTAEVLFFPEEKEASIFPLLDSLGGRDKKAYLELEKRNNASFGGRTSPDDTQYVLTMVFYLLRSLVVTPKKAADFVRRKNEKMRANFSKEELINLYKSVIEIDFKIKSGLLGTSQAEFSLVNLFCHQI